MQNVIMCKEDKTIMFTVFNNGTYVALNENVQSEICEDFAEMYITLRESGWKEVR